VSPTDPRTPAIVGVGQFTQKADDFDAALRPAELMIEAVQRAAADSGVPDITARADAVGVLGGLWGYPDPGRLIADAVGASGARTALTTISGSMAQHVLTEYAARIQRGELDVAVIAGGEAGYSSRQRGDEPKDLARIKQADIEADELFGKIGPLTSKPEYKMGFALPMIVYPLFGSAIRAHRGQSQDENRDAISSLWSDFSRVAEANPYAWDRQGHTAAEIREPTEQNRMVCWPYTKYMNANMFVDQAAAIILCSNDLADQLGVPSDRRVFPLGAADTSDVPSFSERQDLYSSPAIRIGGEAALELAGATIADVAHFDLYSCFPSIVQISSAELGIPEGTQLTQTGGLSLFGGPMNSYTLHAIASMTDTLRSHPGEKGLVQGNGGHVAKQSICLYSTDPPSGFRKSVPQTEIDALPRRALDHEYEGDVVIESCTVQFGGAGPRKAYATGLTDRGNRVLATSDDTDIMEAITLKEMVGEPASVEGAGSLRL
jgi:acetyl-CoA C-acetyltransferase